MKKIILLVIVLNIFINPSFAKKSYTYTRGKLITLTSEKYVSSVDLNLGDKNYRVSNRGISNNSYIGSTVFKDVVDVNYSYIRHLVMDINGVRYTLKHDPFIFGKFPFEFVQGNTYQVRFNTNNKRVYILKPNGSEVRTAVISAIRIYKNLLPIFVLNLYKIIFRYLDF